MERSLLGEGRTAMIWQDAVFLLGSSFTAVALLSTLRNAAASVPLATSLPYALLGITYGLTFFTLGMAMSGVGALVAGTVWSGIAVLRRPRDSDGSTTTDRSDRTLVESRDTATPSEPARVQARTGGNAR